jgi:hypothetical protein
MKRGFPKGAKRSGSRPGRGTGRGPRGASAPAPRRRARLRAAELGRSRGGLTSKVHLSADRRCRPLSFVLTPGQAADSPRFTAVLERIKVRGPAGRPRTRPDAVAADKAERSDQSPR